MRQPALGWLWDNIEAFAVAIAMALVIRHYCIEAFRIPTGSMMPTLRGDDGVRGTGGDRILVDKTSWEWRAPRRFEVAVFRYPLNTNKNFIKRIAGLPGEWLRLADGDVWTSADAGKSWAIARKPAGARRSLFFPYWPRPVDDRDAYEGITCWECTAACSAKGPGRFEFDASAGDEGRMLFLPRVLPYSDVDRDFAHSRRGGNGQGAGRSVVAGDVRLSFRCDVRKAGTLELHLVEHGRRHRLVLGARSSFAEIGGPAPHRIPLETRLEAGGSLDVSFANVDDTLVVELPDDGLLEIPFPDPETEPPTRATAAAEPEWGVYEISVRGRGFSGALTEVSIDRDIYYDAFPEGGFRTNYGDGGERDLRSPSGDGESSAAEVREWRIPEDCYFMLGDNTSSSKDSRAWRISQALLSDGTLLEWEPGGTDDSDRRPEMDNGQAGLPAGSGPMGQILRLAADVDGLVRYFPAAAVTDRRNDVPKHFVPKSHLVGRAFAVFWPIHLPRISPGPTRVKLIR